MRQHVARRRKLVWTTVFASTGVVAANTATVLECLGDLKVAGSSVLGATVMRIHAQVIGSMLTTADYWEYGFIVTRTADVGGTSPNAATQRELDWMLNDVLFPTASGATVDTERHEVIDIRSKRKIPELSDTLVFCATNKNAGNGQLSVFARILLALP